MRVRFFVLAAAALLGACHTASYYRGNENSPYYVVPAGARITVNQELPIAPGQLRVFMQNGRILPNSAVEHLYPYCNLELRALSDAPRTVQPDELVVLRTVQHEFQGGTAESGALLYAAAGIGAGYGMRLGSIQSGGPVEETFRTIMDVRSEKQPQIRRLTCTQWGYQGIDRHVTIAEIRRTLGDLMTLHTP
ncbi:MAG: hypothetical protein ACJ8KO_04165 [Sulfurifustaceae bacterium]